MHVRRFLAALMSALLLATGFASTASAGSGNDAVTNELLARMSSLGIDSQTASALIDKLEAGVLLDSMTGAAPVSEQTTQVGNELVTRSVYADGSVNETVIQQSTTLRGVGQVTPLGGSVTECYMQTTSTYYTYLNCLVQYRGIVSWDSHRVDYRVSRSTGVAHIIRNFSAVADVIGGAVSGKTLSIPRRDSVGSAPAVSRLSYRVDAIFQGSPLHFDAWTEMRATKLKRTVAFG